MSMAQINQRLPQNVNGEFYVDESCIDCDACRQIAPASFRDHGGKSSVFHQPANPGELHRAFMALVACPTASIGTVSNLNARSGVAAFPVHVVDDVSFCGFTAESSFGAWAYFIVRPSEQGGNVLVDSPRFNAPLVKRMEEMGGINLMLLSHRDDIADHAKFAEHFRCPRVLHEGEGSATRGIERVITETVPVQIDNDLLLIPTPGHTRGHQVFLYRDKILFTGDHLSWSPARNSLKAFRDVCWYSWTEQTRSMQKLLAYNFEWVLPGHGRIGHTATAAEMHAKLEDCVARMKK